LGDLVYVELPEVGQDVESGGEMAVVESVKAASDVYAPISGAVLAVNEVLSDDPEKIACSRRMTQATRWIRTPTRLFWMILTNNNFSLKNR